MKLYTEEQAKYFFECGRNFQMNGEITFSIAQEALTPIELPSDEEIDKEASIIFIFGADQGKFIAGAKWAIEQIKQQDK